MSTSNIFKVQVVKTCVQRPFIHPWNISKIHLLNCLLEPFHVYIRFFSVFKIFLVRIKIFSFYLSKYFFHGGSIIAVRTSKHYRYSIFLQLLSYIARLMVSSIVCIKDVLFSPFWIFFLQKYRQIQNEVPNRVLIIVFSIYSMVHLSLTSYSCHYIVLTQPVNILQIQLFARFPPSSS